MRQVQLCLTGERDKQLFISELKAVAAANHMEFLDESVSVDRDLRTIKAHFGYPTLHVYMHTQNGLLAIAGNEGLGHYQVSIGFNGPDDREVASFAERTVSALTRHWTIVDVPKDRGAFPLPSCESATSAQVPNR